MTDRSLGTRCCIQRISEGKNYYFVCARTNENGSRFYVWANDLSVARLWDSFVDAEAVLATEWPDRPSDTIVQRLV